MRLIILLTIILITSQNDKHHHSHNRPKIHHLSSEPEGQAQFPSEVNQPQKDSENVTAQPQQSGQQSNTQQNQSFGDCAKRVSGVSALLGAVGGGATAGVGSAAGLSAAGFTTSGVAAGSVAAGTQSVIGVVQAGSTFSYLQALGAVGQGLLGASVLPATLAIGTIAGGGYLLYECFQTLQ